MGELPTKENVTGFTQIAQIGTQLGLYVRSLVVILQLLEIVASFFFMDNILYPSFTWVGGEEKTYGSGIWSWVDGTPWSYTSWGSGEPVAVAPGEFAGLELGPSYNFSAYRKSYEQSYTCQY